MRNVPAKPPVCYLVRPTAETLGPRWSAFICVGNGHPMGVCLTTFGVGAACGVGRFKGSRARVHAPILIRQHAPSTVGFSAHRWW